MSTQELTLSDKIKAVDENLRGLWDNINEEQQKSLKKEFFILNRYISNVENKSSDTQIHFVITVNEYYNKNYFAIASHPKLLWLSLCMCSHPVENKFFHKWIGFNKKDGSDNKKINFLASLYPSMKLDEVKMLAKLMPAKELTRLAKDYGFDDKAIKTQLK